MPALSEQLEQTIAERDRLKAKLEAITGKSEDPPQPRNSAELIQRFNDDPSGLSPTEKLRDALDAFDTAAKERDAATARVKELEGQLAAVTTERDALKAGQSTASSAPVAPVAPTRFASLENMTLTERARAAIAAKQAAEGGAQ